MALFTFLIAWNSYLWALVLTTDSSMYVLSVGIANMVGEYRVQWNELMAAAVIAALPVMVLYSLLERHLVSAITAGAEPALESYPKAARERWHTPSIPLPRCVARRG